jgi:type II restriction enzyme
MIAKHDFTLEEVYNFEDELKTTHPRNQHVRAKIRQQLQLLRDLGLIRFTARGKYEVVG